MGGRKVKGLIICIAAGIALGLVAAWKPGAWHATAQDAIVWLFASFCGGNAMEHLSKRPAKAVEVGGV